MSVTIVLHICVVMSECEAQYLLAQVEVWMVVKYDKTDQEGS